MKDINLNRIKGINRINRKLKGLKRGTQPANGNNYSNTTDKNITLTVLIVCRLNSLNFADMQLTDIKESKHRPRTYFFILSALYLIHKPTTLTEIINIMGLSWFTAKPIIISLLSAGYIRERKASKALNLKGSIIVTNFNGIELTAKGLDKLNFINLLLTDTRQIT